MIVICSDDFDHTTIANITYTLECKDPEHKFYQSNATIMLDVYNKDIAELLHEYQVDPELGLNETEADNRLLKYGLNQFRKHQKHSVWLVFLRQFQNSITFLLLGAALISFIFHDYTESIAIVAVLIINAIIGFILEIQAVRSMEALKKLDQVYARVIRDGMKLEIASKHLVPGDLMVLEAGDLVTADARLITNSSIEINESVLTGESVPVIKQIHTLKGQVTLADQVNMVFKGTSATSGNAIALVTGTGSNTAVGEISEMVSKAEQEEIPLNRKLNDFSKKLIFLTIALVIPFVILGFAQEHDLYLMIETAIALAVAAIPEGLPIVATISLARGMLKLTRHQVIVKKLAAVETLGEVNVIMTDKTGTLTENELSVDTICFSSEPSHEIRISEIAKKKIGHDKNLEILMQVAALCNNASVSDKSGKIGDPIETALLDMVIAYNNELLSSIRTKWKELDETPFDSDTRIMANFHQSESDYFVSAKGATSEVLDRCNFIQLNDEVNPLGQEQRSLWIQKTNELSSKGLKVLAFAYKKARQEDKNYASELIFLGLIGFLDPPRPDVAPSILECQKAGIKIIMVTGDHPETARAIAQKTLLTNNPNEMVVHGKDLETVVSYKDIEDAIIFSRVSPRQKLELVSYYQKQGWIVGMTGDGVNDAPALRKADIGVAMGYRGTQVAEEAADMVLQNDSFSSIVRAIQQGRIIFKNIKNFVVYLLSCNLSEILVVAIAAFSNLALPLLPLQILFLNLVTDVFPALALGMGKGDRSIMKIPPRNPKEPILNRGNWISISMYAVVLTLSVMGVFLYGAFHLNFDSAICNNLAFFTLAFAQLLHPINLIEIKDNFFNNEIIENPHLWSAVLFCSIILIGVYYTHPLNELLSLNKLTLHQWQLIGIGSIAPIIIIRLIKLLKIIR